MEDMGGGESNNSNSSSSSPPKKLIVVNSPPPKKFVVRVADMSDDMLEHAINIAATAFEKYNKQDDAAEYMKKMLDKFHGPSWHCIVGNFSCYISHERKKFVCFSLEETTICLYKTGAIETVMGTRGIVFH